MKYAYYPGCSAHSTARDLHESVLAVARALGIELNEISGWTCCGATSAHQTDRTLAAALPAANLLRAQKMGMDVAVSCAACYNRLKTANHEVTTSPEMKRRVSEAAGEEYDGTVAVRHFVEILLKDNGIDKIRRRVKRSLSGLKVAAYYGCYLLRPPEVTGFDDPEDPTSLESLIEAMGGEPLEWPGKTECCGGALALTRTKVPVRLSGGIIEEAAAAGAACLTVACPMCQVSLDLRQSDIEKASGRRYGIPVLYITQLLGLCLGIPGSDLGLKRLTVSPAAIIKSLSPMAGR
jgi:heterodisulfide reductase subunit B2